MLCVMLAYFSGWIIGALTVYAHFKVREIARNLPKKLEDLK